MTPFKFVCLRILEGISTYNGDTDPAGATQTDQHDLIIFVVDKMLKFLVYDADGYVGRKGSFDIYGKSYG